MYIKIPGAIYPYSVGELKKDNPGTCFPRTPSIEMLAEFGVYPVKAISQPEYDSLTHDCIEGQPAQVGAQWVQTWQVIPVSEEETAWRVAERDAEAREVWKAKRAAAVEAIAVTTTAGNTFDGDETSQGRMARAIIGLQAAGDGATIPWVLADNTSVSVTAAELLEALALAGLAQAAVWVPSNE